MIREQYKTTVEDMEYCSSLKSGQHTINTVRNLDTTQNGDTTVNYPAKIARDYKDIHHKLFHAICKQRTLYNTQ